MRRPCRHGLKLGNRSPDPQPDPLPIVVVAVEHLIGALCRDNLRFIAVLTDQQIGGLPDDEFGDHWSMFDQHEHMLIVVERP
jgi:hypothetical protein